MSRICCQRCGQVLPKSKGRYLLRYEINGAKFKRRFSTERARGLYAAILRDNNIKGIQFKEAR